MLGAVVVLAGLFLVAASAAGFFYWQYRQTPSVVEAKEIASLTSRIGKTVLLPDGEAPTLATVKDKEKLTSQPFFRRAENGDKVLIYANAGRAILYRPSTEQIIEITSVNLKRDTPAETKPEDEVLTAVRGATAIEKIRIALYNGTESAGLTGSVEQRLLSEMPEVEVTAKQKAARADYTQTVIVDPAGTHGPLAERLARELNGTLSPLPDEEAFPDNVDLLIILGQ